MALKPIELPQIYKRSDGKVRILCLQTTSQTKDGRVQALPSRDKVYVKTWCPSSNRPVFHTIEIRLTTRMINIRRDPERCRAGRTVKARCECQNQEWFNGLAKRAPGKR